jgi:hypothetical protein
MRLSVCLTKQKIAGKGWLDCRPCKLLIFLCLNLYGCSDGRRDKTELWRYADDGTKVRIIGVSVAAGVVIAMHGKGLELLRLWTISCPHLNVVEKTQSSSSGYPGPSTCIYIYRTYCFTV